MKFQLSSKYFYRLREVDVEENALTHNCDRNPTFFPGNTGWQIVRIFSNIVLICGLLTSCIYVHHKKFPFPVKWAIFANIYDFFIHFRVPNEKIRQMRCYKNFVADFVVLLCLQMYAMSTGSPEKPLANIIFPLFILLNIFSLIVPRILDCRTYAPLKNDDLSLEKEFEETKEDKKWLIVKESGAFRIVVENVGTEVCQYFEIVRETKDKKSCLKEKSKVLVKVSYDVLPGQSIVIIPESHDEEGAYEASEFRSFGFNKNFTVKTTVKVYEEEGHRPWTKPTYSTSLVQEFS